MKALLMLMAVFAGSCAVPADTAATTVETVTTSTTQTVEAVSAPPTTMSTTTVPETTTTTTGQIALSVQMRTSMYAIGNGDLLVYVSDATVNELGSSICDVAELSRTQSAFIDLIVASSAGSFTVDETISLAAAALVVYCPDQADRLSN